LISKLRYINFASWAYPPGLPVFYPYIYKQRAFQHEREIRAVIGPQLTWDESLALEAGTPQIP
jgi:hypothetical protein